MNSLGYYEPIWLYILHYLFWIFVLYLLFCVFVLYSLCGCLIPNTIMWSLYAYRFQEPNIYWLFFLVSFSWISFLTGMTPMIRFLKLLKRISCVVLFMKSPIMLFMGNHSTFNSLFIIWSVTKNKLILMDLVHLLLNQLTFLSRILVLLLSW